MRAPGRRSFLRGAFLAGGADPYPGGYSATVERNVREQDADARPAVANPLPSIEPYDTVLLGSPIWNVRAPMIMSTFTEGLDLRGRTVVPFTTHAMGGPGSTGRERRRRPRRTR